MTNEVINTIKERRTLKPENSTRETIPDDVIWQILDCANWAPTHGYTEPWRFVVYSGAAKAQFSKDHAEMYKSNASQESFKQVKYDKIIFRGETASHIIALIMKRGTNPKIPKIEELCAAAAAIQNMLLAASSLNVGTYWGSGGMTFHSSMRSYLELEEEDEVLGFLFLSTHENTNFSGRRITGIEAKVNWKK